MSASSKEWAIVLAIALAVHLGAGLLWWWSPAIEVGDPGASAMRLALAPSDASREDRSETVPEEQDDPVIPEPEPIVEPVTPPREPTPPKEPVRDPVTPVVDPVPTSAEQAEPVAQAPATSSQPSSTSQEGQTGQATADAGVSDADVEADYLARLASWLARHKRYPRAARRRNLQGVATLSFTVNAVGGVVRYEVTKSSGYEALDNEVAKMLRRADPLPALPSELGRSTMDITIPIRFELARN